MAIELRDDAAVRALYASLHVGTLPSADARAAIDRLSAYLARVARSAVKPVGTGGVLLVPILRGGLLLYPQFARFFREAGVGLVQVTRQGEERTVIYETLPNGADVRAVLYLDAVAATGRTIEAAALSIRQRYGGCTEHAYLISATSSATTRLAAAGVELTAISLHESDVDGLVIPDLGQRDAGDLVASPRSGSDATSFPIGPFEAAHEHDATVRELRDELIYRPTLEVARSERRRFALDVGCGAGALTRQLAECCDSVVGYDPSSTALELAMERGVPSNVRFTTDFPNDVERFDFVACCMVLNTTYDARDVIARTVAASQPGCRHVWTVLHPAFQFNETQWRARRAISATNVNVTYSVVPTYFDEHSFVKEVGPARIREVHRPLSAYLNALTENGLIIERTSEPQPSSLDTVAEAFLPRTFVVVTRKPELEEHRQ